MADNDAIETGRAFGVPAALIRAANRVSNYGYDSMIGLRDGTVFTFQYCEICPEYVWLTLKNAQRRVVSSDGSEHDFWMHSPVELRIVDVVWASCP